MNITQAVRKALQRNIFTPDEEVDNAIDRYATLDPSLVLALALDGAFSDSDLQDLHTLAEEDGGSAIGVIGTLADKLLRRDF